jgi:hypothetical protein
MVYGLGAMGEAGVTKALEIIHKELDLTMAFCGHTKIGTVDRSILLPGTFPDLNAARWAPPRPRPARVPAAIGLYLAAVQFAFALGWIVYVAYLPALAGQAGLGVRWVPWLLLADQLVFIATDLAVGLASDRAARVLGRLGRWVLAVSLLSAAAFLALPWVAPQGSPGCSSPSRCCGSSPPRRCARRR